LMLSIQLEPRGSGSGSPAKEKMIGIVEIACFRGEYRSQAAHEDHVHLAANEVGGNCR